MAAAFVIGVGIAPVDGVEHTSQFISGTLGAATLLIGLYSVLWITSSVERKTRRPVIVLVGVPVLAYLSALPNLLSGALNDEETGTVAGLFLFAILVAVCVPMGFLAGVFVLLPAAALGWGAVNTIRGRSGGISLMVVAMFPLSIAAAGIAGAIAMDNVPRDPLFYSGGVAMIMRGFGVHNDIEVVDDTAMAWFRIFAVIVGIYFAAICTAGSWSRRTRVASSMKD